MAGSGSENSPLLSINIEALTLVKSFDPSYHLTGQEIETALVLCETPRSDAVNVLNSGNM